MTLRVGPFAVSPPVVLAPMAAVTDVAFRTMCREQGGGTGLFVAEMVMVRAVIERDPRTMKMASFGADEHPRSLQLYGTAPTAASPTYTGPIQVDLDSSVTVRAIATLADWVDSDETSGAYVVTGTVDAPSFSIPPGTYVDPQVLALTSSPGTTIRYTTDGSAVTSSSPTYTAPIGLAADTVTRVRARAFRAAWADSPELDGTFEITGRSEKELYLDAVATGQVSDGDERVDFAASPAREGVVLSLVPGARLATENACQSAARSTV